MTSRIEDGYYQRNRVFQKRLFDALVSDRDWMNDAACLGADTNLFFHDGKDGSGSHPKARELCAGCSVRSECLASALAVPESEDQGYLGGTSPAERRKLRRARRAA